MIRLIKYSILLIFSCHVAIAQEGIFNCQNSKKFANYLYNTQQYKLAQHEFERINFFCDFDSLSNLLLIKSYRKIGEFEKANQFFLSTNIQENTSGFSIDYRDEYIRLLMSTGKFDEVLRLVETDFVFNQSFEHKVGALLLQEKWIEAADFIETYTVPEQNYKTQPLINIAKSSLKEKRKNPFLATAMSVVIPGSGKMYTGYWGDGLISLAFCISTSLVAYRSYQSYGMNSTYTWIAGGLAVSYYSANIYGGGKAANRYNENIDHKLIHETESILYSDY